MKTMYDVRNLLKRFGTFIYTGDRLGDLDLIENEIDELYQLGLIKMQDFQMAKLCIRNERNNYLKGNG